MTIDGAQYQYPANYGSECGKHDQTLSPKCADDAGQPLPDAPTWCADSWCFVDHFTAEDPCLMTNGTIVGDVTPSNYGLPQHYSYVHCGSANNYPAPRE